LPRGLSSSITLTPIIRVDGQTVASGSAMAAGSEPIGVGGFTQYGTGQWDTTQDQLIVGQQSALGLSIQGISQKQLDTLKTRMEATKAKLQQAQAAPQDQKMAILQGLTGENFLGDMLTATIWGYFVGLQSHGIMASPQAEMFDLPALSYGLYHAQVRPNKLYGLVTTGITFQGLNIDIGHLRHMRWVMDDNPLSAINNKPELTANGKPAAQNRWIAYNRMRGQYASSMEHASIENAWIDKSTCRYTDENGQIQNPTLAPCAQAISAVKAIAIAESEGQKIYTITPQNAATALPTLPVGNDDIRNAIQAGKEVIAHEKAISSNGWTGYGYIIVDPDTGAGSYLIEGGSNGGILVVLGLAMIVLGIMEMVGITGMTFGAGAPIGFVLALPVILSGIFLLQAGLDVLSGSTDACISNLGLGLNLATGAIGVLLGQLSLILGIGKWKSQIESVLGVTFTIGSAKIPGYQEAIVNVCKKQP